MINKVIFAILHPRQIIKLTRRLIYIKIKARKFQPNHQVKKLRFDILSTDFFLKTDFSKFKDIKTADKILAGNLNIYSSTKLRVGKKIDWHKNYVSGYIWPKNKFYQDIKYDYPLGTDIKNPWEVSRFQQMLTVGAAYQKTKNEKYVQYFVDQVTDWIKNNPIYYGVNWKCTMEVAIRATNWLLAYDLFRKSAKLKKETKFYQLFAGSLAEHGDYIFHNLENLGIRSNHYMSDLVGLIWLGLLAPNLPNSQKWLEFSLKEFEKEVLHQFYLDGVNFEASTSYHRLVLELVAYTVCLCHKHRIKFSRQFYLRLKKAFEFTTHCVKPNGEAPQFGDNDSGRLFIFADYFNWQSLDHRYLVNLAHFLFPKNQLFCSQPLQPECWWLNIKIPKKSLKNYVKYFPQGQILIVNKWNWYLAIIAGDIGQDGNGGHAHNDTGSFELSYKGKKFIIDPGTYVYTSNPKQRNKFRSIAQHSVFAIKNQEFHKFVKGNLFGLENGDGPEAKFRNKKSEILFSVRYSDKKLQRTFKIDPKSVKILDQIKFKTQHQLNQNLILARKVKTKINQNKNTLSNQGIKLYLKIYQPKLEKIEISKAYNQKIKSNKITNSIKSNKKSHEIKIYG